MSSNKGFCTISAFSGGGIWGREGWQSCGSTSLGKLNRYWSMGLLLLVSWQQEATTPPLQSLRCRKLLWNIQVPPSSMLILTETWTRNIGKKRLSSLSNGQCTGASSPSWAALVPVVTLSHSRDCHQEVSAVSSGGPSWQPFQPH